MSLRFWAAAAAVYVLTTCLLSAQCPHRFADIFQSTGAESPQPGGGVALGKSVTSFVDAGKNTVFIGGRFTRMAGLEVNHIASWDGSRYGAAGLGPSAQVTAITKFDDGTGEALYAAFGGAFPIIPGLPGVYRRNGTTWTQLGTLMGFVQNLVVANDGSANALYAVGQPHSSMPTGVSKWTGSTWIPVGGPLPCSATTTNVVVTDLVRFDDGTGPTFWASTDCGASLVPMVMGTPPLLKLVGNTWVAANQGLIGQIRDLEVFDSGSGPELYIAGGFSSLLSSNCAKKVGTGWSPIGAISNATINRLTFFNDGQGTALYAGVNVTPGFLKLVGSTWVPVGGGVIGSVDDVKVGDDGRGPALFITGFFGESASGQLLNDVARWDGQTLTPLTGQGTDKAILALAECTVAGQKALYAGGIFGYVGANPADRIAKFDGSSWSTLGAGISGATPTSPAEVYAIAEFDDGMGPAVYAAGNFTTAGGVGVANIARWNGSSWAPLGSGINGPVFALAVYDSGQGPRLYAAGSFSMAGGVAASNIASWNGSTWSPLGMAPQMAGANGPIYALEVFAQKLVAGGSFTVAGNVAAPRVAFWNGTTWTNIGSGIPGGQTFALATISSGGATQLWAGGSFGVSAWNGSTWFGGASGPSGTVAALKAFDDGTGPTLIATGFFTTANSGGNYTGHVAQYRSSQWTIFGPGIPMSSNVSAGYALEVAEFGAASALYIGGDFRMFDTNGSSNIARWEMDPNSPLCAVLAEPTASGNFGAAIGGPYDVLTVNGATGQGRRVNIGVGQPFSISITQPFAAPSTAPFVLFGYLGIPTAADAVMLLPGLGAMSFTPCPLAPTNPQTFVVADGFGLPGCVGVVGATPAPWTFGLPFGLASPITATFQGIIADSSATYGVSITNAVAVIVGF